MLLSGSCSPVSAAGPCYRQCRSLQLQHLCRSFTASHTHRGGPDPAVLGLKCFFRCTAPRWIQLDSSAGSKPGTSFSFSWLKCQPGSWRENGKAASLPYPTLHPLRGPCLCSMPDTEFRVFMWFPGQEKDKRFSPLVWTRGTGKSEAVNTTNSSAPRGAGWASRLAQH